MTMAGKRTDYSVIVAIVNNANARLGGEWQISIPIKFKDHSGQMYNACAILAIILQGKYNLESLETFSQKTL